jgi:hypothetical protein
MFTFVPAQPDQPHARIGGHPASGVGFTVTVTSSSTALWCATSAISCWPMPYRGPCENHFPVTALHD